MNFYFCETCGRRLTDEDLAKGLGRNKKLKGVYCQGCAEGVLTIETLAIQDMTAKSLASKPDSAPSQAVDPRRAVSAHRPLNSSRDKPPRTLPAQALLLAGAAIAVGAIGVAIALSGRGQSPKTPPARAPEAHASAPNPPAAVPAEPRTPAPKPPTPPQPVAAAPTSPEPTPAPARPPETPEEAPRSIAESSSIGVSSTSLLALPSPPASDSAWKPLFNHRDLTGLSPSKGTWRVQDKLILGSAASGDARLDTAADFGDGEFICEIAGISKYTTIRLRENVVYKVDLPAEEKWITFRGITVGDRFEASVDGMPLKAANTAAPAAAGKLRIFISKQYSIKIRDLRWREISARELPQK